MGIYYATVTAIYGLQDLQLLDFPLAHKNFVYICIILFVVLDWRSARSITRKISRTCIFLRKTDSNLSIQKTENMLESAESRCDWLWCASRNVDWATKCKRKRCDACDECDVDGIPRSVFSYARTYVCSTLSPQRDWILHCCHAVFPLHASHVRAGNVQETVTTEILTTVATKSSTKSDDTNSAATVPIGKTAPATTLSTIPVPTTPATTFGTDASTINRATTKSARKEESCANKLDKLSTQQCKSLLAKGLCKDFVDQCESTCNGCCLNKRNKLSLS